MRGRFPKPPNARLGHRSAAEKGTTRRTADDPSTSAAPATAKRRTLPKLRPDGEPWHAQTRRWWREAWTSPAAAHWLESDFTSIVMLAVLVDDFSRYGKPTTL